LRRRPEAAAPEAPGEPDLDKPHRHLVEPDLDEPRPHLVEPGLVWDGQVSTTDPQFIVTGAGAMRWMDRQI
jgi:hypothetical protein